ncbi:hypothetical protein LK537_08115 [Lachnoclostridium pacaense]|uniref:hypothetical protein n=1 Tax=Enterocloster hominis (ex Hitch et al. 2024) TaxID=1917870 RepID=UPI001D0FCAB9|nr:hypothetical protein [Lachnoclostridium pacaense]MCC2817252.1 hypothetical protein [Lachnoclostridium pacaense]
MSEKKGLFGGLFGGKKSGCCNMEIVEETESSCGCAGGCCSQEASAPVSPGDGGNKELGEVAGNHDK